MRHPERLAFQVRPTVHAAAIARGWLEDLRTDLGGDLFRDLELVVSELVTNCVRHANLDEGDTIDLSLELSGEGIFVEVCDCGEGFDPANTPAPKADDAGGRGLWVVREVAAEWGVSEDGPPTTVWCLLRRRTIG
jgi:serine/threonine-protein kinase RsbW